MDLVVDANILFAALIKDNITAELLFKDIFHLYAPEFLLEEFVKHKEDIIVKSDRPKEDFERFLDVLKSRITFYPYNDFKHCIERAMKITPDPDDTEYIALALSIKASIWSNDKALKDIEGLDVYSTGDLIKLIHEL